MKLLYQSNLPDSGAVLQIWSDEPLSAWDSEAIIRDAQLLLRQAQRREAKQAAEAGNAIKP